MGISGGGLGASLLIGALAVLMFGASLIAHEYAHALMARRRGIGVRKVQMWALGGLAELESEPRRWNDEFAVSVVGPLMSLAIGAVSVGAAVGLGFAGADVLATLLAWAAVVNIGLGVFNLLPGFPLDGGRVLHSLIWWRTGKRHRATAITAGSGRVIGAGLIAFGVWSFVNGNGGLLTAFVGWFILSGTTGPAPGAGGTAPRRHPGRRRRSPPTSGGARRPHGRRLRALLAPCQPHDI
ncbi:MAG: site-2 protease family protein [Microthrixaceae bacterium]